LCTKELFREQVPRLSVLADVFIPRTDSAPRMRDVAARILREVAAPRFSVAGLSMGGYLALEMAAQPPTRIERVALLSSQARADTARHRERRAELVALSLREGGMRGVAEMQAPLLLAKSNLLADPSDTTSPLATTFRMANETSLEGFENQQTAIANRRDLRHVLSSFACPVLLAGGREDALIPIPVLHEMANLVRGSPQMQPEGPHPLFELVVESAGHLITLEAPEQTSQALEEWMRAPPGRAA
jgi:pimeloyl-ACP methyl ester carboxylesterase